MSTKTMRPAPRRVAWVCNSGGSKRKEREDEVFKRPTSVPVTKLLKPDETRAELEPIKNGSKPMMYNEGLSKQLLAGYMAHEVLTKGTLLGRPLGQSPGPRVEPLQQKYERYAGLTHLLNTDGPQLPGVVNPAQLAHFLRLF